MAYREVEVSWIREVLRRWRADVPKKRIARELGLCPKTVRRYVRFAEQAGLSREVGAAGPEAWLDAAVDAIVMHRDGERHRPHGDSWQWCESNRDKIVELLGKEHYGRPLKLKKVHRTLGRPVPYSTLHRFAVSELGFGRPATTVPVADGAPGDELQIDTGWVAALAADHRGQQRKVKAWIFTAVVSRHRFVWPIARETTEESIAACEAAWAFFGGVFKTLIPDNTKAIVEIPDPTQPKIVRAFLEYSEARDFFVDPARVRRPQDKGRVERAVPTVRDDCFAGEEPKDLDEARRIAERWCLSEYGLRPHTTTGRRPLEHFEAVERPALMAPPSEAYDVPVWSQPRVQRDQHARVQSALYSLPVEFVGKTLEARANRTMVRFYEKQRLVAAHPRVERGQRSTDKNHFDADQIATASRDAAFFVGKAREHSESIGAYAQALFAAGPFWQQTRCVRKLLDLVRRYGAERVDVTCQTSLAADLVDVNRLARMLELPATGLTEKAPTTAEQQPRGEVIKFPTPRFLRPSSAFQLTTKRSESSNGDSA